MKIPETNNNITIMGTLVMDQANRLLDFNQPNIDVQLLDNVINVMYEGKGTEQKVAQEVLTKLREHPDSWTRVDAMLEFSSCTQTKYYALQILEGLVTTRWKTLPREQCDGIKKYIVGLIIKLSSDAPLMEKEHLYVNKLNMVLVQIVKREWPKNWPEFITEIVGASKANESLCKNNMVILKLLSEEVFDFSAGQMTQAKAHHMKQQFCGEFQAVFQLCQEVLETSQNPGLVESTLNTLLRFLNWIPLGYIFETNLIEMLTTRFLDVPIFRNITLQCLTEIAGVSIPLSSPADATSYDDQLITMFLSTMTKLCSMLPLDVDIRKAYSSGTDAEQKFISNLALFLCTFLKERHHLVEFLPQQPGVYVPLLSEGIKPPSEFIVGRAGEIFDNHQASMQYLLAISEVDDVEIFKICLEYWNWLTGELYREHPFLNSFDRFAPKYNEIPNRRKIYTPHFTKLRYIMIGRMAKPEEVLVVENEQGDVVRETIKDTDSINLYKTMRETLVYLCHLDFIDTERIMTEKLDNQVRGTEWSWKNLNTLCWAIGSISGSMMEEDEKRFLVTVIRDLLGLCEQKRGKDNKAIIAANIMYVVGQYPRFLRAHWKFLKTVVNKLFEFLHESHEGVQDMACETFIKIAQKCKRHFVITQVSESQPFINEILNNLGPNICDLTPAQVQVFYEAVGCLISAQNDPTIQEGLIEQLMSLPNTVWDEVVSHASANVEVLKDPEVVKNMANILKTNVAACRSIGNPFAVQLGRIYMDMLNVYKVISENISNAVTINGESILKQSLIKSMRGVKTEILNLINTWLPKADDKEAVLGNFVPPLFEAVLFDYQRNVPAAREPEVLSTITTLITKLENTITPRVPQILEAVFECTLNMINKDFHEFPEHRIKFFELLQSINDNCFESFFNIPPTQFKLILDSIIWGFKHSMRNVAEMSLEILHRLLVHVVTDTPEAAAQSFFQTYFLELLEHIFSVVTDTSLSQVAGLTYHSTILAYMFEVVEKFSAMGPLNTANPTQPNTDFVFDFVGSLLQKAFPHLTLDQIRIIVKGFFAYDSDVPKFKDHLRDFLIQIKEFAGQDTDDLYLEDKEKELQNALEDKKKFSATVPGLLNPYELKDEAMGAD
uniref:Exportin-1 n=2 Tax=Romanomermis culicivorax TaxID=13658 RepID=A0A915JMD4_ROMCU